MRIEFKFEEKDLEELKQQQIENIRLGKAKRTRTYVTILALYFVCFFINQFFLHAKNDLGTLLVELFGVPGALVLTVYLLEKKLVGSLTGLKFAYSGEIGTHVYELSNDIFVDKMEGKTEVVNTRDIASVEKCGNFVVILFKDMRNGTIPTSGVIEGNLDEFVETVSQYVAKNKKSRGLFQFD